METLKSLQQNLTASYCIELDVLTATTTYYRVSMFSALTISTSSAIVMIYFIAKYYRSSILFHSNLRMLYFFLSLCCLSFDIFNIIMKIHHLTVSFLFENPCEIIMPKIFFIATSVPLFFSMGGAQFAQMSMVIERWIAILYVRDYESGYRKLGPALIAAAIVVNCGSLYFMYYGETFDTPQWNARSIPTSTYPRSSVALLVMLTMNFIALLLTIALYFFSRRRRRTMTLSSKFQANENAIVSRLLFWTSSIQFTVLCLTQIIGLYLRTYQIGNPLRTAYRENLDLFNYYTLILPLLSTVYFAKVKRKRAEDITNQIDMKATGSEGWINYSKILQNQWK
uniref:Serpentine receptor class gamma n=1 Tax=Haemonchus contortus TaxID=6289 RepID=A0A7I4YPU4_HAECO